MKYCPRCGAVLDDRDEYCKNCGEQFNKGEFNNNIAIIDTLNLVSFILMLISTIFLGFAIIPLAWCIPMTVSCYTNYKNHQVSSIGLDYR